MLVFYPGGQVTLTSGVTGTLPVGNGGTGATTLTDKAVLISQDSGTDTVSAVAMDANGELLIGGTSGPAVATLTAGNSITITNGDGTITIASTASGASPAKVMAYGQVRGVNRFLRLQRSLENGRPK